MSVMTSVIPHGRPFTVDDLEGMPDDGNRYELIDGMLLVSPAPVPAAPGDGRSCSSSCCLRLVRPICGCSSRRSPCRPPADSEVQPDVLVARFADFGPEEPARRPAARRRGAVAVSTRLNDLNLKKAHYERMGVASYWILDPTEPGSLTAFELDDEGRYQQVAHVEGDDEFVATRPFPVTVVPARLLDGLRPR